MYESKKALYFQMDILTFSLQWSLIPPCETLFFLSFSFWLSPSPSLCLSLRTPAEILRGPIHILHLLDMIFKPGSLQHFLHPVRAASANLSTDNPLRRLFDGADSVRVTPMALVPPGTMASGLYTHRVCHSSGLPAGLPHQACMTVE